MPPASAFSFASEAWATGQARPSVKNLTHPLTQAVLTSELVMTTVVASVLASTLNADVVRARRPRLATQKQTQMIFV
jgi:hypothetical protein